MTKQAILSRLLSNISDEYDKAVGSFFYDAEYPVAIEIEGIHAELAQILKNALAKTAGGSYLDDKVAEQGLTRKPATFAVGIVQITGENGAVVPLGTKVASDTQIFSTTAEVVLENGTANAPIHADTAGSGGNLPSGAINHFPVTLAGLVSVSNPAPTDGGYHEESDDELRARYFEKVSAPVTSGNANHYKLWAKEVAGVGDAKVIETWAGGGTVKVIIVDTERGVACGCSRAFVA